MAGVKVDGIELEGDEDLTEWERLQIVALAAILQKGRVTVTVDDVDVLLEYTDR